MGRHVASSVGGASNGQELSRCLHEALGRW